MRPLVAAVALLAASLTGAVPRLPPPPDAPFQAARRLKGAPPRPPADFDRDRDRPFDQPREAHEFFLKRRLPAGVGNLPVELYFAARDRIREMPQHVAHSGAMVASRAALASEAGEIAAMAGAAAAGWSNLGPGNVGGRTLALLIDPGNPSTMWAGTADGGIWKTTDAGAAWQPVGDLLPSLAVSTLVMDPSSRAIYAGTGEGAFNGDAAQGAGVFQSVDGGDTWNRMPGSATADFFFVNKLAVSPTGGRLYAATSTGVWRFDAAGRAWAHLLAPSTNLGCFDLALHIDGAGNDVLLAACGSFGPGAIYHNARAQVRGTLWDVAFTIAGMGRTSLAVAPSNPEIVYAVAASNLSGPHGEYQQGLLGVWRSTAGGIAGSWQARLLNTSSDLLSTLLLTNPIVAALKICGEGSAPEFINQGWYDTAIAVDPTDANRVWVGGIDLFRSDDGGQTFGAASYWWAKPDPSYNHADQHALVFAPGYNGGANQTLFIGNDGGVFVTRNALARTASGRAVVLCQDTNSSVTFENLNHGYTATQFYAGAVLPGGVAYFGGTQDNGVIGGSDRAGADAWSTLISGDGGDVAVDPTHGNVLYAENTNLSIQRSTDGGKSFAFAVDGITDSNFLFIAPLILDPRDPARLYAGGSYLWRTTNAGASWTRASALIAGPPSAAISAIAVSPVTPDLGLMGTDGGFIHHSSATTTATASTRWAFTQPRSGYVSGLTFDPAKALVAYATYSTFGGNHVWKTTDGGATWKGIDGRGAAAFPNLPANGVVVDPATGNVYVATDMGVFFTANGGAIWAPELTHFPDTVIDALVLHAESGGRSLYAFTHGRGAWRVTLH